MAETKTIVILANSVRSGHRCVAGKELKRDGDGWEVGSWIRLTDPGTKDARKWRGGTRITVIVGWSRNI